MMRATHHRAILPATNVSLSRPALGLLAAVLLATSGAAEEPEDWHITIVPREVADSPDNLPAEKRLSPGPPPRPNPTAKDSTPSQPAIVPEPVHQPSYSEVYHSIPFHRSEYEANPAYRHQATLELMLGELRPISIDRSAPPPPTIRYGYVTPYAYRTRWGTVNYHFYYPRPTVYRNY